MQKGYKVLMDETLGCFRTLKLLLYVWSFFFVVKVLILPASTLWASLSTGPTLNKLETFFDLTRKLKSLLQFAPSIQNEFEYYLHGLSLSNFCSLKESIQKI